MNPEQMLLSVHAIVLDATGLGPQNLACERDAALLGVLPELDSAAVLNVILSLEDTWGIEIADADVSADDFLTLGSLLDFVQSRSEL